MLHSSQVFRSDGDNRDEVEKSKQPVDVRLGFSHLDGTGRARMVNVGAKARLKRVALARGEISIGSDVLERLLEGSLGTKGDILSVAKIAGIMGAKATSHLIPMCHQIPLDHVQIDIKPRLAEGTLLVEARAEAEHKTGVELECMTAVSVALLTIYDMCKSASHNMIISNVRLVYKKKLEPALVLEKHAGGIDPARTSTV
jgi:cyclic pyranopterin phosphate synthase